MCLIIIHNFIQYNFKIPFSQKLDKFMKLSICGLYLFTLNLGNIIILYLSPKLPFIKILSKYTQNYFYNLDNNILREICIFKLFLRFL